MMCEDDLKALINLLNRYGEAKFGDEWWPGNPDAYLSHIEAERLKELLEEL